MYGSRGPWHHRGLRSPLDNTTAVETPEHVRFRYRVAGPSRRALAYLVDLVVRGLGVGFVAAAIGLMGGDPTGQANSASVGVLLVVFFLVEWGYFVFFESFAGGVTPGKRLLGLRVVKEGGFPVGFVDSVLRNLLRAADFLPVGYILGLASMFGDRKFRRLGDRVAATMVVSEGAERPRAVPPLFPPATPDELAALPQRLPLSASDKEALELFLRRPELPGARRRELAAMVAPVFAKRLELDAAKLDPERFLAIVFARATQSRAEGAPQP